MMGAFAEWQPRYAEHGIATFPVTIVGKDKKPAVKGYLKLGSKVSDQLAIKFPEHDALGLACRKNRITVLDIDAPDENLLADGLAEHGPTPFIVRSGSGNYQAWYRHNGERRRVRPDPARPVDILGDGFVVAPPSLGSRGRYELIQGSLDDLDHLPTMRPVPVEPPSPRSAENSSQSKPQSPRAGMREGDGRNDKLFRRALRQAHQASTKEELIQMVSHANQQFAEPLDADEVLGVANSAWKYKQQNRLFVTGGEATAVIFQSDIDHLWDEADALALLVRLRLANGFRNGGEFPLASTFAGSMDMSVPTFRAARDVLVDRFFLEIVHPGGKGKNDPPLVRLL